MRKHTFNTYAKWTLKSVCASAKSDQILRCRMKKLCRLSCPKCAHGAFNRTAQLPRLIWIFTGHTCMKVRFLKLRLISNTIIWCSTHEKGPYAIYGQCRPWSAKGYAQAELGLRCPFTKFMALYYMSTNKECPDQTTDAHAHLDLRYSHWGLFPLDEHYIHIYWSIM